MTRRRLAESLTPTQSLRLRDVRVQLYTVAVVVSSTRRSYVRILTVTADCRPISEMSTTESEVEPPAKRFKQTTLTQYTVLEIQQFEYQYDTVLAKNRNISDSH